MIQMEEELNQGLEIENFFWIGSEKKKTGIELLQSWNLTANHELIQDKLMIDTFFQRVQLKCETQIHRQNAVFSYFQGLKLKIIQGQKLLASR